MSVVLEKAQQQDGPTDLARYIQILLKHWVLVVGAALVGLIAAFTVSSQLTPQYESTTTLYVSVRAGDATGDMLQGTNFAQAAITSYVDVVTTAIVLDEVSEELEAQISPAELDDLLEANSPADSVLLEITATHRDPETAALIASTTGEVFIDVVENEIESTGEGQSSPVYVQVVDSAFVPEDPASPNIVTNSVLGLLIGAIVGVGIATMREFLDTRLHTVKDLEQEADLPVLGRIPEHHDIRRRPLIVHDNPRNPRAEAFRSLRTNLQFLSLEGSARTFTLSSAMPDEGKTHVVANLALVLAESGARVTLIEADLRNPKLGDVMGIEGAAGLSDVLIGRAKLSEVTQLWGMHNITVLTAGQTPPNPSELLGSQEMRNVLQQLGEVADYVLIDAPPILPVTDAAVISSLSSGTLLVAALGQTKRQELAQAIETLRNVEGRILGVIANREPIRNADVYGDDGMAYGVKEDIEMVRRARRSRR